MSSEDNKNYPEEEEFCVSRIEATRLQIDAAIKAFFLWDDLVSAMTLSGAAERVLSDLQPQGGLIGVDACSIRALINLYVKDEFAKEAAKHLRGPYDFLRHADRNQTEEFRVHPVYVEFMLFLTSEAFRKVTSKVSNDMAIFLCWFLSQHPDWLKKDAPIGDALRQLDFDPREISKSEFYKNARAYFALSNTGKQNG